MRRIPLFLTAFLLTTAVFGQKTGLKKANRLFKEEKYATAIPYFKKVLSQKNNQLVKTKLALCYKLTNQLKEALSLYEEIIRHPRAKSKTYYYYAETLMSLGKYEEAKIWFQKYASIEVEDENVHKMIASCDFAKTIPPFFGDVVIRAFQQNSDEDDTAPVFWDKGIVFTSDRKGKLKFLDTKSGVTNRNHLRLYHSKQLADGSFDKPTEYISRFNDARKNTGMATFQEDGSSIIFTRNGTHLNKQNAYCLQLFEAISEKAKHWQKPKLLSFCNRQSNYMHPALSPNGKLLFFVSDKPGGLGGTDIYMSKKTKKGWSKPQNLGNVINTQANEGFPFVHQNGTLYFCSKGHLGLGGYDIFSTRQLENGEWEKPTNLGSPINSPSDDISIFISKNRDKGVFTSSREGGDDDIFIFEFGKNSSFLPQTVDTTQIK